ncbi:MAG TPA: hypothetical protein VMW87_08060 [Spirochaetia bacterium]|nr:hypothetical protein [Spirochaetia bacterium]
MKLSYRFLAVVVGAAILGSCASTPKPAAPAPAATPAATATAPSPDAELQKAKDLKALDEQFGLDKQVPAAYEQGVTALNAGQVAMGKDNAAAKAQLDQAISAFQQVYDTGFPVLVADREQEVATAKKNALAAKADKAVPDQFQKAQSLETQAADKKSAKAYKDAYDLLGAARDAYTATVDAANKKRIAAEAALKKADAQIEQTKTEVDAMQKNLDAANSQSAGGQ